MLFCQVILPLSIVYSFRPFFLGNVKTQPVNVGANHCFETMLS